MFSSEIQDELLVLRDDVKNASLSNKGNITIINDNFNTLSIILKKLDIKLIFMPVVDKYDLYHEYIVGKYPKNNFFPLIRPLTKKYIFVDTKAILKKQLKHNDNL